MTDLSPKGIQFTACGVESLFPLAVNDDTRVLNMIGIPSHRHSLVSVEPTQPNSTAKSTSHIVGMIDDLFPSVPFSAEHDLVCTQRKVRKRHP